MKARNPAERESVESRKPKASKDLFKEISQDLTLD